MFFSAKAHLALLCAAVVLASSGQLCKGDIETETNACAINAQTQGGAENFVRFLVGCINKKALPLADPPANVLVWKKDWKCSNDKKPLAQFEFLPDPFNTIKTVTYNGKAYNGEAYNVAYNIALFHTGCIYKCGAKAGNENWQFTYNTDTKCYTERGFEKPCNDPARCVVYW